MPAYKSPSDSLSRMANKALESCLCPMGAPILGDLLIGGNCIQAHAVFSFENEGRLYADFTSESPDFYRLAHSARAC